MLLVCMESFSLFIFVFLTLITKRSYQYLLQYPNYIRTGGLREGYTRGCNTFFMGDRRCNMYLLNCNKFTNCFVECD